MKRVLTALALIPCVLGLILLAPPTVFVGVAALLTLIGLREFFSLADGYGVRAIAVPGYAAGVLWVVLWVVAPGLDKGLFVTLFALALLVAGFLVSDDLTKALPAAAITLIGTLYVAGPLALAGVIRDIDPYWLLFPIVVSAIGDVAALYVGKSIGKHSLTRVSPNKTWEGTIGSTVFSVAAGVAFSNYLLSGDIPVWESAALSLAVNVAGQFGDLAESSLKRGAGVKDSGNLLPGHGGLLDRIDAFLFSMPLVYAYLSLG